MKNMNLPAINTRYWVAFLLASVLGTTSGDFVADGLNVGFIGGLAPMAAMLAVVFFAERQSKVPTEAYYWLVIVITRTAATNLADFSTHALGFGYPGVAACLTGMLAATLLIARNSQSGSQLTTLPTTNTRYWTAILIASTLGTVMGDFCSSHGLNLGVGNASILLGAVLAVVLFAHSKAAVSGVAAYWLTVVLDRTAGTTMGDFLAGRHGLNLGTGWTAAGVGLVLLVVLSFWKSNSSAPAR